MQHSAKVRPNVRHSFGEPAKTFGFGRMLQSDIRPISIAGRRTVTAVPCHVNTDSHGQLVGDSLRHFQPVKITQKRRDVVKTPMSVDQWCLSVECRLQQASKRRVASRLSTSDTTRDWKTGSGTKRRMVRRRRKTRGPGSGVALNKYDCK